MYNESLLPNASIVLIYHNEALSVLIRMIESILKRTPSALLHEIVLLDDYSDDGSFIFVIFKTIVLSPIIRKNKQASLLLA